MAGQCFGGSIRVISLDHKARRADRGIKNSGACQISIHGNGFGQLGTTLCFNDEKYPDGPQSTHSVDDLSGEDAQETVLFGVDGVHDEIELTAAHATELRGVLEKYVVNGRRLRGTSGSRGERIAPLGREETQKIREWAKANGYSPSARGRIGQG